MKKQLLLSLFILVFVGMATTGIILYGKGYIHFDNGKPDFYGTGILAVSSTPEGAGVYINGHIQTATNNTVNLQPGEYDVKIYQDNYLPWEKQILIKKEFVSKADARLFPKAPTLQSITDSGIANPVIDPTFTKIAFVASPSAYPNKDDKKNGIFVLDMSNHQLLPLQSASTQLVDDTTDAFSTANITWSPDGKNIIASISANRQIPTSYLLDTTNFNQTPQDVTETLTTVHTLWEKEKSEQQTTQLNALKPVMLKQFVANNFSILGWSQDGTKILYQASMSATMQTIINPPLWGNSTPEERSLQQGSVYVYDIKEDKNFKILDAQTMQTESQNGESPIQWLPDNMHLIHTHDNKIQVMDYDGLNTTTVYAGPFIDHYVFPWPDSSKIVILTNLNNDQIPPNLYTISLK